MDKPAHVAAEVLDCTHTLPVVHSAVDRGYTHIHEVVDRAEGGLDYIHNPGVGHVLEEDLDYTRNPVVGHVGEVLDCIHSLVVDIRDGMEGVHVEKLLADYTLVDCPSACEEVHIFHEVPETGPAAVDRDTQDPAVVVRRKT